MVDVCLVWCVLYTAGGGGDDDDDDDEKRSKMRKMGEQ